MGPVDVGVGGGVVRGGGGRGRGLRRQGRFTVVTKIYLFLSKHGKIKMPTLLYGSRVGMGKCFVELRSTILK